MKTIFALALATTGFSLTANAQTYSDSAVKACFAVITQPSRGEAFDAVSAERACVRGLRAPEAVNFSHYKKFCSSPSAALKDKSSLVCEAYLAYALMSGQQKMPAVSPEWARSLSFDAYNVVKQEVEYKKSGGDFTLVYEIASANGIMRCQSRFGGRHLIKNLAAYRQALEYDASTTLCEVALPKNSAVAAGW